MKKNIHGLAKKKPLPPLNAVLEHETQCLCMTIAYYVANSTV